MALWNWLSRRETPRARDPIAPAGSRAPVNEYADRYPEAYGHGEDVDAPAEHRHFTGLGLPRQVRDSGLPPMQDTSGAPAVDIRVVDERTLAGARNPPPAPARHEERPRRPLVERSAREICNDVWEQLEASPFIDATAIMITVNDTEVLLEGTINSLIAVSLAQAIAGNVPGVTRVQTQLNVRPAQHVYESSGLSVRKTDE